VFKIFSINSIIFFETLEESDVISSFFDLKYVMECLELVERISKVSITDLLSLKQGIVLNDFFQSSFNFYIILYIHIFKTNHFIF
jgi:hypothetical protein